MGSNDRPPRSGARRLLTTAAREEGGSRQMPVAPMAQGSQGEANPQLFGTAACCRS